MSKLSFKVAYPIIIAGIFVTVIFMALNYQSADINFYIVLSTLVVYIFLFGFATGQNFSSPVKKMLEIAENLNKGNLKSRFYLESKDELGELARAFNRVADNLEESRDETQKMEKSVDMKVRAKTQEMEEIIGALEKKVQNRTTDNQRMLTRINELQQRAISREKEFVKLKDQVGALRKNQINRPVAK